MHLCIFAVFCSFFYRAFIKKNKIKHTQDTKFSKLLPKLLCLVEEAVLLVTPKSKKPSSKLVRKTKRKIQRRDNSTLLGSPLGEQVVTDSFRSRQKFGAASEVRRVEVTEEILAEYDKLYKDKK